MLPEEDSINTILKPFIGPWYESLENPQKAQEQVLTDLISKYALTDYGLSHNASQVKSISDYKKNFPIINYSGLIPYFNQIREGNFKAILPEPAECWVMTRGSTGKSKVLPATQTHLKQIFSCGARGIVNFAIQKKSYQVFMGSILNLNFPSNVRTMDVNGKEVTLWL